MAKEHDITIKRTLTLQAPKQQLNIDEMQDMKKNVLHENGTDDNSLQATGKKGALQKNDDFEAVDWDKFAHDMDEEKARKILGNKFPKDKTWEEFEEERKLKTEAEDKNLVYVTDKEKRGLEKEVNRERLRHLKEAEELEKKTGNKKIEGNSKDGYYIGFDRKYAVIQKDDSEQMKRIKVKLYEVFNELDKEKEGKKLSEKDKESILAKLTVLKTNCDYFLIQKYRRSGGIVSSSIKYYEYSKRWNEVEKLRKRVAAEIRKRKPAEPVRQTIEDEQFEYKYKKVGEDLKWYQKLGFGALALGRFLIENPLRLILKGLTVPVWAVNEGIRKIIIASGGNPQRHIKFPGLYRPGQFYERMVNRFTGDSISEGRWYDRFLTYYEGDKKIVYVDEEEKSKEKPEENEDGEISVKHKQILAKYFHKKEEPEKKEDKEKEIPKAEIEQDKKEDKEKDKDEVPVIEKEKEDQHENKNIRKNRKERTVRNPKFTEEDLKKLRKDKLTEEELKRIKDEFVIVEEDELLFEEDTVKKEVDTEAAKRFELEEKEKKEKEEKAKKDKEEKERREKEEKEKKEREEKERREKEEKEKKEREEKERKEKEKKEREKKEKERKEKEEKEKKEYIEQWKKDAQKLSELIPEDKRTEMIKTLLKYFNEISGLLQDPVYKRPVRKQNGNQNEAKDKKITYPVATNTLIREYKDIANWSRRQADKLSKTNDVALKEAVEMLRRIEVKAKNEEKFFTEGRRVSFEEAGDNKEALEKKSMADLLIRGKRYLEEGIFSDAVVLEKSKEEVPKKKKRTVTEKILGALGFSEKNEETETDKKKEKPKKKETVKKKEEKPKKAVKNKEVKNSRKSGRVYEEDDPVPEKLDIKNYPEEKKAEMEAILRKNKIAIPSSYQEVSSFRLLNSKTVLEGENYIVEWKKGITQETVDALNWISKYYIVRDESRTDRKKGQKLVIPNHKYKLPDDVAKRMIKANVRQGTMNCYCCSGALVYNQFLYNEQLKKNPQGAEAALAGKLVDQYMIREFEPEYKNKKKFVEDILKILGMPKTDKEAVKDAEDKYNMYASETRSFAGKGKKSVGNVYEIGDFFLGKQKDIAVHKINFVIPSSDYKSKLDPLTKENIMVRFSEDEKKEADQQLNNIKAIFLDKVYKILQTGNAVSILSKVDVGSHYMTIIGVDGQNITYVDSLHPGEEITKDVSYFMDRRNLGQTIEINWFSRVGDIKELKKEYKNLEYDKKKGFSVKNHVIGDMLYTAQTKGITVSKDGEIPGVTEYVYLPQKYKEENAK